MKAFYKTKLSDGYGDTIKMPARRLEDGRIEVQNGDKWHLAEGCLKPDSISETDGFYTWDPFAGRQVYHEF